MGGASSTFSPPSSPSLEVEGLLNDSWLNTGHRVEPFLFFQIGIMCELSFWSPADWRDDRIYVDPIAPVAVGDLHSRMTKAFCTKTRGLDNPQTLCYP